jgi:Zn-finger nucleic acid-binding protein
MKCPACGNNLKLWRVGTIEVDVCDGGCGGVWFDAFELQKAGQAKESVSTKLARVARDETLVFDPNTKRECPRCHDIKLKRHFFSPKTRVHVDQCPSCGGYWLDYGELSLIHDETSGKAPTSPNRPEMSMEVIRFLYRLKTREAADSTPPPVE